MEREENNLPVNSDNAKMPEANKKKKKKKNSIGKDLFWLLVKIGVIAAAVWAILEFVTPVCRATGNNMFPAVRDGDLCILYKLDPYYVGDVVAYIGENGKTKLGRIVAKQGSEIYFPESGGYTVDGTQPNEEIVYQTFAAPDVDREYPLTVPEGMVFIMNDFRSDYKDSRTYGMVSANNLIGKLLFLLRRRGF